MLAAVPAVVMVIDWPALMTPEFSSEAAVRVSVELVAMKASEPVLVQVLHQLQEAAFARVPMHSQPKPAVLKPLPEEKAH